MCETIVLPGKCNAPDKKKDFLDKPNDWTKNYDSSGEETAKKKGKRPEVISSIMAKLEITKNIHLVSIWYPFGYTYLFQQCLSLMFGQN